MVSGRALGCAVVNESTFVQRPQQDGEYSHCPGWSEEEASCSFETADCHLTQRLRHHEVFSWSAQPGLDNICQCRLR
eukprot:1447013-Alexandrium_andersonii.AAC.1